ncbi:DUF4942 domain-containing protein [Flavobacterium sp. ASW18X]|uniref:class I SAM-dependent methyltransferase n=1 Tax=Flavobacterium sp. ASW18X TaxID=2572595 RepID=UPI0010AE5077|nr:DUF4942 domain-containing protein [Flavobacterium sp. ASW18X]TKD59022.1 DUF4942 domain-containing protein [Flavobacterium sp. ASW18X]
MFGEQFYPTPEHVIKIMLEPYSGKHWKGGINGRYADCPCGDLHDKTILEPSAGKGDIINYIKKNLYDHARQQNEDIYAIELDPSLASILKDNDISVIGSDFLTYQNDIYFDVIVMNPPFKNGDAHLLKAIEIAHDTDIVCLLNAETLLNPHTDRRKLLLQKIEQYGSYEILGPVFSTAERRTDVNVALVRLHVKDESKSFDFDFTGYEPHTIAFDESFIKDEIARKDLIGNMMLQLERSKAAYKEYIEAEAKWHHVSKPLLSQYQKPDDVDKKSLSPIKRYNNFNNRIKANLWRNVITELQLERYMTSSIRQNFQKFVQQQSHMAFDRENVKALFDMLMLNSNTILEQCITEVFDMLTANYYSENRMYVEGWKTNDRYKVNRKVIAPCYVTYGEYTSAQYLKETGSRFSMSYSGRDQYTDIDKMLCYISGKPYEQIITIQRALENKFDILGYVRTGEKFDNTCKSTFFDIKFHKKGTVHLTFRDKRLWQEFNMRACNDKNWLPDNERTQWEAKQKAARENDTNTKSHTTTAQLVENTRVAKPKKKAVKAKQTKKQPSEFQNQLLELFLPDC